MATVSRVQASVRSVSSIVGVQRRAIVGVLLRITAKTSSPAGLSVRPSRNSSSGTGPAMAGDNGREVAGQAEAELGRAVEGAVQVEVREHVALVVPRAAQQSTLAAHLARVPLLHVAGHVLGAERTEAAAVPDGDGSVAVEVADTQDVGEAVQRRRPKPVVHRRQARPAKTA